MAAARRNYEEINSELLDELPALFDSRITFYVAEMQVRQMLWTDSCRKLFFWAQSFIKQMVRSLG